MLTLEDCIAFSELSEDEVRAIAAHEHLPEIVAAELAVHWASTSQGCCRIVAILRDGIAAARARGDRVEAARLVEVLRRFVALHPTAAALPAG